MPTDTVEQPATTPEVLSAPSSETPAPEAPPTPAAEKQATPEAQDAPTTEAPNFRDVWKGMSPQERAEYQRETWDDDVKGSPWLQGKFGSAKQRAEREQREYEDSLKAQARAEWEAELKEQRRREAIASDDAYALLELEKQDHQARTEREQRTVAEQQEAVRLEQYAGSRLGQVAVKAFEQLPDEVQAALKAPDGSFNRHWAGDGTAEGGLAEAIKTAIAAGVDATLKTRTATLRSEIEAAVRAELGVAAVAKLPSPDTRGTAAEAVTDDRQFLKDYADGRSSDHARWRALQARL